MEIERWTRYGAYGIVIQDNKILLTPKTSGPYKGLWDLPGGGIEFGESPEVAFKRELREEAALNTDALELYSIINTTGAYAENGAQVEFHHLGIIYKVDIFSAILGLLPEDEVRWVDLSILNLDELTPIARKVLKEKYLVLGGVS